MGEEIYVGVGKCVSVLVVIEDFSCPHGHVDYCDSGFFWNLYSFI